MENPEDLIKDAHDCSKRTLSIAELSFTEQQRTQESIKSISDGLEGVKTALNGLNSDLEGKEIKKLSNSLINWQMLCIGLIFAFLCLIFSPRFHCLASGSGQWYTWQDSGKNACIY